MAPRSLRPQLNQIRAWVRQGRTDAWIAHQLEVSVKDLRQFKRDHELEAPGGDSESVALEDDLDLRAADDELVAAALESETDEDDDEDDSGDAGDGDGDDESGEGDDRPKRRRGRRGGRGRRPGGARRKSLEGTFDHGEDGYGLWLDPAVQDDPVYAEHWAGHRPVTITIEQDRIVIQRAGEESSNGDDPAAD